EIQPKLLRFLQDGEIQRLGETMPQKVDVRVIAATNRNLEEMVKSGDFRADLYYRLNVIQLHLPPLRDRREEIPLLVEHFLERYTTQMCKEKIAIDSAAMDSLVLYDWPGNARQLENEIYRLVALSPSGRKITCDQLTAQITAQTEELIVKKPAIKSMTTLADTLSDVKRQVITDSLTRHRGNLSRVAKELGLSRFGLRKMLSQLELDRQRG
ncbi:MAG TPA: sigma 54-interacting transcriptional regulator, partial [Blastocatellia bacterium]|nr:sigma 54-interacting transcriptional regulator [Blastocatellia bacterium]